VQSLCLRGEISFLGRSKKTNPLFDGLKAAAETSIFGESIVCSGLRPFQENESLFDGLKAAAEASLFGESIVCSGLRLSQNNKYTGVGKASSHSRQR
jgi:hypothetical protein